MQKAKGILQLTITVLLMTIKASDSSNLTYINCYECKYESMNSSEVPPSDVCYSPSRYSGSVPTCVGLSCLQSIIFHETRGITVERKCVNATADRDDCNALSYSQGKSSQCVCTTAKCNGGAEPSKAASSAKNISFVVLVTMVFALCFVSAMIYK